MAFGVAEALETTPPCGDCVPARLWRGRGSDVAAATAPVYTNLPHPSPIAGAGPRPAPDQRNASRRNVCV